MTDALADRFALMVSAGNTNAAASAAVGISLETFHGWMRRGRNGEQPFAEFRERVMQSRGEAEVRSVTQIATAAGDDWRAASWLLEKQRREDEEPALDTAELVARSMAEARAEAEATLDALGESLELSQGAVSRYAAAVGVSVSLEAQWEATGRPAIAPGGATGSAPVPHPLIAQIALARREAAALGSMLGMDPMGRMKLSRHIGAGRPPGAASARDRVDTGPPRRRLRVVGGEEE